MKTQFLGTAYRSRSKTLASDRCVNLYPEIVETGQAAAVGAFYGTPGLRLLASVGTGPIRGMLPVEQALYVVSGVGVYRVSPSFVVTQLGTIPTGSGAVSIISNGAQTVVFDGINGYLIYNGAVSTLSLPFANPASATFQDGFGLVSQAATDVIWQSNYNDLSTWNSLNFQPINNNGGNIQALIDVHRQVYIFKETKGYFMINAGNAGFSFQLLDGVSLEFGCAAPNSVALCHETVMLVAQADEGRAIIYGIDGYEPRRRSTHAIEWAMSQYPTITDAIAYSYQQEGHYFYQVTFPSGNATWVLDLTASARLGYDAWHERAAFSNGQFSRHQTATMAAFSQEIVVGDFNNGNLYAYDLDVFTDNGAPRKWLRSWRALAKTNIKPARGNALEIQMESGLDVVTAGAQAVLRQSFDGSTWSSEWFAPVGALGQTQNRLKFNRLGVDSRGLGSDRIFELSSTDAFKVALLGADMS